MRQAKAAASRKSVGVHGSDTIQQLLNAGLLDEISVDVDEISVDFAALLVGCGIRLFDHLEGPTIVLGDPRVIAASAHPRFAVRRA